MAADVAPVAGRRPSGRNCSCDNPVLTPARRACGPCDRGFVHLYDCSRQNVSSASGRTTQLIAPGRHSPQESGDAMRKSVARPPQRAAEVLHRVAHRLNDPEIPSASLCRSELHGVPVRAIEGLPQTCKNTLQPVGAASDPQSPAAHNAGQLRARPDPAPPAVPIRLPATGSQQPKTLQSWSGKLSISDSQADSSFDWSMRALRSCFVNRIQRVHRLNAN